MMIAILKDGVELCRGTMDECSQALQWSKSKISRISSGTYGGASNGYEVITLNEKEERLNAIYRTTLKMLNKYGNTIVKTEPDYIFQKLEKDGYKFNKTKSMYADYYIVEVLK